MGELLCVGAVESTDQPTRIEKFLGGEHTYVRVHIYA